MLKVKSKRDPCSSKRNKSIGKKSKKRFLQQQADVTSIKSKVKGKKNHRSDAVTTNSDSSKQSGTSSTPSDMQSMTAYEYYIQCRTDSEERRKKRISSKMRGPISKKRMRALHALKTRTRKSNNNSDGDETVDIDNVQGHSDSEVEQEIEDLSIDIDSDSNEDSVDETITDCTPAPQFFNSTNSTQVLLLLKGKLYFHGALKIRLLAGEVCIFGYAMQQNETVTANSPRGHSFLYLSPSRQQHQPSNDSETIKRLEQLKIYLKKLSSHFLRDDLQEIISNFDQKSDAVVLLENDFSKSIFMIENYMKETMFPNVHAFTYRPFQQSESILRSQFLLYTTSGLTINPQWQDISMSSSSRHVIIGGKGVGKSTFLRYFINRNLRQHKNVLLIDLDIGQPEMFLPQTVSATIITEPILGPGYLRNKSPKKSYLFGDVNVLVSSIKYLKCVLKILKYCHSVVEFRSIPWVVNTMGYSRGFGLELIVAILRSLKPTDLIQIQADRSLHNFEKILSADEVNNFEFSFFDEEVKDVASNCSYSTHICDTMSLSKQKRCWDISPRDLRYAMILSKLGNILTGSAKWITDVRPVCASLNDLRVIIVNDDSVTADLQPKAINGNLVYLCRSNNDDSDDILECFGLGIVRSVETTNNKVYLLPSISQGELQHVNTLAICSIPLPTSILINQSTRIAGCVPYAYSSDNFIGSKQIVPISYRPDKQASIKSNAK